MYATQEIAVPCIRVMSPKIAGYLETLKNADKPTTASNPIHHISRGVLLIVILPFVTHENIHSPYKIMTAPTRNMSLGVSKKSVVRLVNKRGVTPATRRIMKNIA